MTSDCRKPLFAALFAAVLLLSAAPSASAASGSFNCGPSLRVRTNDNGTGLHTHVAAGVAYQQNTGPSAIWVRKRWASAPISGSWSTTYSNGYADCT
jgi:carbohydrate-selective porin OprB